MAWSATRILLVGLLLAALGTASAGAAAPPKKAKPCKASEVKRKVTYVKRAGGKEFTFKACTPRVEPPPPATFGKGLLDLLRQSRKSALRLAPKRVLKLTQSKAAKRVAATDATSDPPLVNSFGTGAAQSAQLPTSGARASAVSNERDTVRITGGPPGTNTTMARDFVEWDATEDRPGSAKDIDIDTESTVDGMKSSKNKAMKLSDFTDRCPNAGGVARGEVKFQIKETHATGDGGVVETVTVVDTKFSAKFDENARIASVEVTGETSWTTETRVGGKKTSHRAVSATVGLESLGADKTGTYDARDVRLNFDDIVGTDQVVASEGVVVGLVGMQMILAQEAMETALLHLQQRAERCMKLVPEPAEVHVKPGGTVALAVRLNDYAGQPRSGPVKTTDGSAGGTVSPKPSAEASPVATFTYYALSTRPPGGIDKVEFSHRSKQGRASGVTVTIVYDEPPRFPIRFEGTWTRVETIDGKVQTVQGEATFVRNPLFESWLDSEGVSIPYEVESASITWTVSGSDQGGGHKDCRSIYSGSGSDAWSPNGEWGAVLLGLQDVTKTPGAPQPEPQPYYYSIRVRGQLVDGPKYTVSYTPECKATGYQTEIGTDYLDIGHPGQWTPEDSQDEVEKSAGAALLAGHRIREDEFGIKTDDTWHFTGTG